MKVLSVPIQTALLAVACIANIHAASAQESETAALAASKCDVTTAKRLILSGANSRLKDKTLRVAVEVNCTELVEFLLSAGANVNAKEKLGGATPLMIAARRGYMALVKRLLAAGAEVNARNDYGWSALNEAVIGQQRDTAQVLLDAGVDVNAKDGKESTALMQAASGNQVELIKMLLAAGAQVDAKNSGGWTALVYAACSPKSEALKVLVAAGAKTEVKDAEGKTPLMWAAFSGSIESVKELLSAEVNVNDIDKDGKSALAYAREAKEQSGEIVALLISAGALDMPDLNHKPLSNNGMHPTPYHEASHER